jgi:hypothetical protein
MTAVIDPAAASLQATPTPTPPLPSDDPPALDDPMPRLTALAGSGVPNGHATNDVHGSATVGDDGVGSAERGHASAEAQLACAALADPTLALLADILDDLERSRIANQHRLRELTTDRVDSDGVRRGGGIPPSHPTAVRLAALVEGIGQLEHQAALNLGRLTRAHPLGPWITAQAGVGDKQAARLLAAIGDPYWHTLHDRPRTVSELWAFCGLHTVPAGQGRCDAHATAAGGDSDGGDLGHRTHGAQRGSVRVAVPAGQHGNDRQAGVAGGASDGDPGQAAADAQMCSTWVAARRRRGERANWSPGAKTRALNIARKCVEFNGEPDKNGRARARSPYRDVYDQRRAHTEGRLHAGPCPQCGPSGSPAQPGSEWSAGHRHADAVRVAAKTLLRDLWREARRIHTDSIPADQSINDVQPAAIGGDAAHEELR